MEFQRALVRELVFNSDLQVNVEDENRGMILRSNKRSRKLSEECSWATKKSKIARGGHELVRLVSLWGSLKRSRIHKN